MTWKNRMKHPDFPTRLDIHIAQMIRAFGPDKDDFDEAVKFCCAVYEKLNKRKKKLGE